MKCGQLNKTILMAYKVACRIVTHSCENWRKVFFSTQLCSDDSTVHVCKLTRAQLGGGGYMNTRLSSFRDS